VKPGGIINGLGDLRPGDIMFGPIGGMVGLGVGLGQLILGEAAVLNGRSIRHAGIVVLAGKNAAGGPPRLAQAMPNGAEIVNMSAKDHWTKKHIYIRLPEDYPGQALAAARVAMNMVGKGVDYSWASYASLAAFKFGLNIPRLGKWINRRRPNTGGLPVEAICSVFVDQAWSLAGKTMVSGTQPQAVTPGRLVGALLEVSEAEVTWP
jgi:hypothetical protein